MPTSQNYKNHTRFDPLHHFVIAPLLILNLIFSIWATHHNWPIHAHLFLWWIVMSIALILLSIKVRYNALKVQDRLIRLEERLRLSSLLSPADFARCAALTEDQYIGLRFASDAELPSLVDRTLKENLTRAQIKQAISTWRADHFRV